MNGAYHNKLHHKSILLNAGKEMPKWLTTKLSSTFYFCLHMQTKSVLFYNQNKSFTHLISFFNGSYAIKLTLMT